MRVLVCPDKFAGTLTAADAAQAIAAGWRDARPDDEVTIRPLADGGPGFLDVLASAHPDWVRREVPTTGPLGAPVVASLLVAGATTYVETAQTCGLGLLPAGVREPLAATTYGLGVLLRTAAQSAPTIVLGVGGSATNDGGAGMLAALGAVPVDEAGDALPPGGAALARVAGLAGEPTLAGVTLVGACDVESPLVGPDGATAVFGPQKGVSPEQIAPLDAALGRWASVLSRLPTCPPGLAELPGSGAAGGLGAAILACGGRLVSGFDLVRTLTGFDELLAACDLVVTGEGSFDDQSLRGKAVGGVAAAAGALGVPCLVLAGRVSAVGVPGVTARSLVDHVGAERALGHAADALRELARASAARVQ